MSDRPPLARWPDAARWATLALTSLLLAGGLERLRLPVALLLGPLLAAVAVQSAGASVRVPRWATFGAQAVIGCLVARSITPAILTGFLGRWPLFLGVVLASVAASAAIGWTMGRLRVVPGSTAVWGMIPGAATVMTLMAEAYGADVRLVAFMQYLRVVLVALAASTVALLVERGGGDPAATQSGQIEWLAVAETAAVAIVGGWAGRASSISAGVLLGPLVLGAALAGAGLIRIDLPLPVLIASYAAIGWDTGMRFTREVLASARRVLPQVLAATALLIGFCGLLAGALVLLLRVDPLTAYLATSPGGVDAVAIIAASAKVDTPFVMALQVARVLLLIAIGPSLAR